MNRITPEDSAAASHARQRPHTSDRAAAGSPPAPQAPQQQDVAAGQSTDEMISTTAEFQADGAP